jgi:hypothetical protein
MNIRSIGVLILLANAACSGGDSTELFVAKPLARSTSLGPDEASSPFAPPPHGVSRLPGGERSDREDVPASSMFGAIDRLGAGTANVSPTPSEASDDVVPPGANTDAGTSVSAPPCTLRLDWTTLAPSHAGCTSLSALPEAALAVWDGARLLLLGAEWTFEGGRLERTRRCMHGEGRLWRFEERLVLVDALPPDRCPEAPIAATYVYDECPLLSPGVVCAADEPSACQLSGTLTLTPVSELADPEALAAPEIEASCRPVGRDPRRPAADGERCYDGECAAGLFCSRENGDGSCAPLGEGRCLPAPLSFDCGSQGEDLCTCGDPPMPLSALPLFDPTLPDALPVNTCTAHALGLSITACRAD